jgi:hypothetical protein
LNQEFILFIKANCKDRWSTKAEQKKNEKQKKTNYLHCIKIAHKNTKTRPKKIRKIPIKIAA